MRVTGLEGRSRDKPSASRFKQLFNLLHSLIKLVLSLIDFEPLSAIRYGVPRSPKDEVGSAISYQLSAGSLKR